MESLICSVCGKCSGIIQVSQSGLHKFVCDQCSLEQAQTNCIPGMKSVETMKSEYYNQAIISFKHHESILSSFKSQMMQFRSELENILHLTFDKSIRDIDELSLEIQKKCKSVETIEDTEKEQQVHTGQTAQAGLHDTEFHNKEALIWESDARYHGKGTDKSNMCFAESQVCKEVQTSKVDDGTHPQYELKIRDLEQKLNQISVEFEQKERETLELMTQAESIKRESAAKDVKLLGLQKLNEAMVKKLKQRDAEILQLKSQNSTYINTVEGLEAARLRSQVEDLAQQISAKQAAMTQLEATCKDFEMKLSYKDDIISQSNDLKYKLSAKDSEISQRISELRVAASLLADKESEISKLVSEYEVISKELLSKDFEMSQLKAQYSSKLDHESQLMNRVKSMKSVIICLLAECRSMKHDNLKLSQELIRYKEEAKTLYLQLSPRLHQIKELQLNNSNITELETTIQKLTDHNQILEKELRDMQTVPLKALNVSYQKETQIRDDLVLEEEDNLDKFHLEKIEQYEEKLAEQQEIYIEKVKHYEDKLAELERIHLEELKQYEEKINQYENIKTNLKKLNFPQGLKVEHFDMRYEDLYSQLLRSNKDYKSLDSDLKTSNLSSTFKDTGSITLCLENILEELCNPSVVSSIHIAKRGTRSLVTYDVSTQESATYLLSNITYNFKYTSTCALSNGDVMIAGGCHPATGDSYLFRAQNKHFYKLASLNHPRGFISLIYHNKKIYAFGGSNVASIKKAEEYDIATNGWRDLPDMLQAREGASCVSIKDNIYIIGGGTTTIEEYSIERRLYRMMGMSVSHYGNVGAVVDDKVYIIGYSDLLIADNSLAMVNTVEKRWDKLVVLLSNVVIEDGSIWYYNHWTSRIERLSLISHERKDLVSL